MKKRSFIRKACIFLIFNFVCLCLDGISVGNSEYYSGFFASYNIIADTNDHVNAKPIPVAGKADQSKSTSSNITEASENLSDVSSDEISFVQTEPQGSSELPEVSPPTEIITVPDFSQVDPSKLKEVISSYEGVSVFFEDIASGYNYSYNDQRTYFSASVIKAPYMLYLYKQIESGALDINQTFTYEPADVWTGSGIIKDMEFGSTFTLGTLMDYTIVHSDNVAFRKLAKHFGSKGFNELLAQWGLQDSNTQSALGSLISARDTATFAREIYKYIEGNNTYSETLKTNMMSTTGPMIKSQFPLARKSGGTVDVLHDMAIVYAPSNYILVIMSTHGAITMADLAMFEKISLEAEKFSLEYFPEPMPDYSPERLAAAKAKLGR